MKRVSCKAYSLGRGAKRRLHIFFVLLVLSVLLLVWFSNLVIKQNAKGKMFSEASQIPKNKVGLLLGTIKYLSNGQVNLYYQFRVQAAVELYKSGKIDVVLISGDNGTVRYDEPTTFKNDLIALGIPENKIYLDYAGFRTLDSVVRAKHVFGQDTITIISQAFHNERALYLAEHFGITAFAYNARSVSGSLSVKVTLREYLARVKVFLDILTGKQPKFLGDKISIQ